MAVSTDEYNALLARLTKLERTMNDVVCALERCTSTQQVTNLFTVIQQELDAVTTSVTSLQERVEILEDEPYGDD